MYEGTSMADDVMIKQEQLTSNPCCITWKDKYIKLKEGYTKLEERRIALRKAVDDEKLRANNEKEEKVKESALRASLESEVARLKNEILSLKKNDGGREITELKEHLSQRETKVNELNELLEKERLRADSEKKKADLERKKADDLRTKWKAEKTRADEERRLADVERKRAEGNRLNLENLKKEADQVKSKLASVTLEFEDAKKNLEAERENTSKERKRADAAVMKAADQKKIVETDRKMAMDEKSRATDLYRQLEQDRQEIDNLNKEISELMASGKMVNIVPCEGTTLGTAQLSSELGPGAVERDVTMVDVTLNSGAAQKRIQDMEQKVLVEKKRVKSEMKKKENQIKAAEAYKKKASEEKDRADQLSEEVENYRKKVDELQKETEKLISARSFVDCPLCAYDSNVHIETAKGKLLKEKLKFEKRLVKHAKEVAKFEKTRNYILQQNLLSLKQEFVHFSRRLNILDGCFFQGDEHDLEKVCSFNLKSNYSGFEACDTHCHLGNDTLQLAAVVSDPSEQKINCSVPSLPVFGGNNPGSISGINSKLEPLLRGSNKKVLQSSAMNSSSTSFSDRLLVGSQERCASITTSAKSAGGKLDLEPTISSLSGDARKKYNENVVAIAESNIKSPISCISTERRASHHKRMRRSIDAIEYNENLNSEGNKRQRQLAQKTSLHDGMLNSRTDGHHDEKKNLVAGMQHDMCSEHFRSCKKRSKSYELGLQLLNSSGVKSDVCAYPSPPVYNLPQTAQDWKGRRDDDLGDIDELVGGDYIKLLNLDNDIDEESYRLAIEMPLSPTLPEIQYHSSVALESINTRLYEGFSNAMGTLDSSGNFDVINVEINSNQLKHRTFDPPKNSSLPEKKDHVDSSERLNLGAACKLSCNPYGDASGALWRSDLAAPASEGLQISLERRVVPLWDGFAKYCVILSSNNKENSISSVYRATSSCIAQCSTSGDASLGSILVTLLNLEEISNKAGIGCLTTLPAYYWIYWNIVQQSTMLLLLLLFLANLEALDLKLLDMKMLGFRDYFRD